MSLGQVVILRFEVKRLRQLEGEDSEGCSDALTVVANGATPFTRPTGVDVAGVGETTRAGVSPVGKEPGVV